MTFLELVQARLPARHLGATVLRVRVAQHREGIEVLVVGLDEPVFIPFVEMTCNGVYYVDVLRRWGRAAA